MALRQDVPPEIASLVPAFLERREKEIDLLRDLISVDDFDGIEAIAHKLKGNGASFGFPLISKTGAELEIAARAKDGALSLQLIEVLNDFVSSIKRERMI